MGEKLIQEVQKVSAINLQTFTPFKNTYYCTHCGFSDTGNFCSNCGKSLSLSRKQFIDSLIQRVKALGYKSLSQENQIEHLEKSINTINYQVLIQTGLYNFYNIGISTGVELGITGMRPSPCLKLEIVTIANGDEWKGQIDSVISDFFLTCVGEEQFEKVKLLNKRDRVREISIKLIAIDNNQPILVNQNWQLNGTVPKLRELPKYRRSFKYSVACKTYKYYIDLRSGQTNNNYKSKFDPVLHELTMAFNQLKGKMPEKRKATLVNVLFDEVLEYFGAFGIIMSSPSVFAEAFIRGDYLTTKKVWSFFLIGILFPALILYIISFGSIQPNEVQFFSNLPPFLSDLAESSIWLILILLDCIICYCTFLFYKRHGSFKKLFLALLAVNAFFILANVSIQYLVKFITIDIFSIEPYFYNIHIVRRTQLLLGFLHLYLAYPFFVKLFKVGLKEVTIAFILYEFLVNTPIKFLTGMYFIS